MPTPTTTPGSACWIELLSSDPDASRAFYGELLGWTFEDPNPDFGGYSNARLGDGRIAGLMDKNADPGMAEVPDLWSVYLRTDDAAATAAAIEAAGGTVAVGPHPVGDMGSMVVAVDPTGATIGAWQAGTHTGFAAVAEAGAPGWFELFTRDHAAAVAFYEAAFGWTTQAVGDTDDFRYTVQLDGGEPAAGVMDATAWLPAEAPAHWSVYFAVDDTDASVATATRLGATVMAGPEDTPYGRMATLADPNGAVFKLTAPSTE